MKTLTKKLWVSILTLAVIFCTVLGFVLSTPLSAFAEETTTTETVDYSALPSNELESGDNLFGKYLFLSEGTAAGAEIKFNDDLYVDILGEITDTGNYTHMLGQFSVGSGECWTYTEQMNSNLLAQECTIADRSGYLYDFTQEITLEAFCETHADCENNTTIVLNADNLTVEAVTVDGGFGDFYLITPLAGMESKTLEVGDKICPAILAISPDYSGLEIGQTSSGRTITFDNNYGDPSTIYIDMPTDTGVHLFEFLGADDDNVFYFKLNAVEYTIDTTTVAFSDGETLAEIRDGAKGVVTLYYELPDVNETPDTGDGSSSEDSTNTEDGAGSEEETPGSEKWIVTAWENVKTFCTENYVAVICSAACLFTIIICIIIASKKRK